MRSIATRNRRRGARLAIGSTAIALAALGAGASRALAAEATGAGVEAPEAARVGSAHPFADRFPNLVLRTHEGRNVRFYDDLLKGKIVLINFMYASCGDR